MIKGHIGAEKWQRDSRVHVRAHGNVRLPPAASAVVQIRSVSSPRRNKVTLHGGDDTGPDPKELVRELKCFFLRLSSAAAQTQTAA